MNGSKSRLLAMISWLRRDTKRCQAWLNSLHHRCDTNNILEVEDFAKLPFLKEHILNTGEHAFTKCPMYHNLRSNSNLCPLQRSLKYLTYQVSLTLNIEVLETSSIYS